MYNVIDFRDHANLFLNEFLEGEIRQGNAYSYGLELMIKKDLGKLTGWASYTLSKTMRKIDEINDGKEYYAPYDKPHDFSLVLSYKITDRLRIGGNWVYSTGAARTFPTGRIEYGNMIVPVYSDRNSIRIPDYHRLDLSLDFDLRKQRKNGKNKKIESSLNLSIYNVYNRKNPWVINFQSDPNDPNITYAEVTYLFGIIPSITYNFRF